MPLAARGGESAKLKLHFAMGRVLFFRAAFSFRLLLRKIHLPLGGRLNGSARKIIPRRGGFHIRPFINGLYRTIRRANASLVYKARRKRHAIAEVACEARRRDCKKQKRS